MILIHPPVAKPCEPPAGLAKLSGALDAHGVDHTVIDANLEGMEYLLEGKTSFGIDTWTRRAGRNISANLAFLRSWAGYDNFARYRRAVSDVNRILERSVAGKVRLSLADYADRSFSPTKSEDLLYSAEHPQENIFFPYFSTRLKRLLEGGNSGGLVGLSLNYLSQALSAFAIVGFLRREYPRLTIVLGGGLVTSWASSPAWKNPFAGLVDEVVSGPGELPLLSLCGVEMENKLIPPRFDRFPLSHYLAPGLILPFSASVGCYWRNCSFCPEKAEGTRFSPTPPPQAVADITDLSHTYRPALVHLVDNALSPALMTAVAKNPFRTPWYGFARITRELADDDFCGRLRESGCVMLKLGLESGDQRVLDALGKGIDLETAARSLAALKHAGIATYVYLLFGTPEESLSSAEKTLDFVAGHATHIDFLNLAIFNLPINSHEANTLNLRRFYEGDLSLYADFEHPLGWNRREVRAFLEKEFKMHPAVRPILLRQPPFFTSNHAPFFAMKNTFDSGLSVHTTPFA